MYLPWFQENANVKLQKYNLRKKLSVEITADIFAPLGFTILGGQTIRSEEIESGTITTAKDLT